MIDYTSPQTTSQAHLRERSFINKVYGWMTLALVITAGVALYVASTPALINLIFGSKIIFYGIIILELAIVFGLSGMINKMSAGTATALFVIYSALNGLTFATIFLAFTAQSIASTFFVTAGTFGVMTIYGFVTKRDLTKIGSLMFMGLIGIVIASVVNIFLQSSTLYWIVTYAGVIIFVGLIAYDTQKIKNMSGTMANSGSEIARKGALMGALALYLDFINLFLMLLRIFGNRD